MNTLEFLTEYITSPVVAHRKKAMTALFAVGQYEPDVIHQLARNLKSKNYNVVLNSLYILRSMAEYGPERIKKICNIISVLGRHTDHFSIAFLSKEIIDIICSIDLSFNKCSRALGKRLVTVFKPQEEEESFYTECDYYLEYSLGSPDFKYELNQICDSFRYDCKKAAKKVFAIMRKLGYRKGKKYSESRPAQWRNDFNGLNYETMLFYYSRHAIQIFLMWCIENLPISKDAWDELVRYERKWDPTIPDPLLVKSQPAIIGSLDLSTSVDAWVKKRLKKNDVYELIDMKSKWVPLYESTDFKHGEKSFSRHVLSCCIKLPINSFSVKTELGIPNYRAPNSFINELPIEARKIKTLHLENYFHNCAVNDKLVPNYGISFEEYDSFVRLFPAPEIIESLGLRQKKNTLEYYKGEELVIQSINWRGGYERDVDGMGQDRYQQQNYGHIMLIKSKYLAEYLKKNKLKLIALGDIWKRKIKKYGGYDYNSKDTRHKRASLGIFS